MSVILKTGVKSAEGLCGVEVSGLHPVTLLSSTPALCATPCPMRVVFVGSQHSVSGENKIRTHTHTYIEQTVWQKQHSASCSVGMAESQDREPPLVDGHVDIYTHARTYTQFYTHINTHHMYSST